MGLNHNTACYRLTKSKTQEKEAKDFAIKERIEQIQLDFPYYGYRNITHEMEPIIEQKLSSQKMRLEKEQQQKILPLKKQKNKIQVWFESLRSGSDDVVFSELRQAW